MKINDEHRMPKKPEIDLHLTVRKGSKLKRGSSWTVLRVFSDSFLGSTHFRVPKLPPNIPQNYYTWKDFAGLFEGIREECG